MPQRPANTRLGRRAPDLLLIQRTPAAFDDYARTLDRRLAEERRPASLLLTGGVAANSLLRAQAKALADDLGLPLFVPPIALSTDNAAMIGAAAFVGWRLGRRAGWDLNADTHLPLA